MGRIINLILYLVLRRKAHREQITKLIEATKVGPMLATWQTK